MAQKCLVYASSSITVVKSRKYSDDHNYTLFSQDHLTLNIIFFIFLDVSDLFLLVLQGGKEQKTNRTKSNLPISTNIIH